MFAHTYTCTCPDGSCYTDGKCHHVNDCIHKVITNEDMIRSMSHDKLRDFLENTFESMVEDIPWYSEFDKVFCRGKCNLENCVAPDCPYGDPVDWWLNQIVEE